MPEGLPRGVACTPREAEPCDCPRRLNNGRLSAAVAHRSQSRLETVLMPPYELSTLCLFALFPGYIRRNDRLKFHRKKTRSGTFDV